MSESDSLEIELNFGNSKDNSKDKSDVNEISINLDDEKQESSVKDEENEKENLQPIPIEQIEEELQIFDNKADGLSDLNLRKETIKIKNEIVERIDNEIENDEEIKEDESNDSESAEITTFSEIEDDPLVEKKEEENKNIEYLGETTINGIKAEIVCDNTQPEPINENEMKGKINESVNIKIKHVKNEAAEKLKTETFDISEFNPKTSKYAEYYQLLNDPLYIPRECVRNEKYTSAKEPDKKYVTIDSFVQEIARFPSYSWKNLPSDQILLSLTDSFIVCKKMNQIFSHEFGNTKGTGFRLDELAPNCFKFLSKYSSLSDLNFEHRFLVTILGKIEVLLNTNINICWKSDLITVSDEIFKVFHPEINAMEAIQSPGKLHHVAKSWFTFVSALFNLRERKNFCFDIKQQGYEILNEFLRNSYCYNLDPPVVNYQMEELVGNTLKMYSNIVVQCFFFMIRSLYIMLRLVSIYIQKFMRSTRQEIAEDIHYIALFAVLIYEHKHLQWKGAIRTPSKVKNGGYISNESQMFIDNFMITGGQYYLLKAVANALPILAFKLKDE